MMFFFIFFFVGLWTLIVNILPNNGKEWVDDNQASIFTQMSLGNHGVAKENYDKLEVTLQPVFHLIVIFLLLLFCIYIRIKILQVDSKIDEDTIVPSDFCAMLTNIPKYKSQRELESFINERFKNVQIEKIIYAYEIYDIVTNLRQKQDLVNKIEQKSRFRKAKENEGADYEERSYRTICCC